MALDGFEKKNSYTIFNKFKFNEFKVMSCGVTK